MNHDKSEDPKAYVEPPAPGIPKLKKGLIGSAILVFACLVLFANFQLTKKWRPEGRETKLRTSDQAAESLKNKSDERDRREAALAAAQPAPLPPPKPLPMLAPKIDPRVLAASLDEYRARLAAPYERRTSSGAPSPAGDPAVDKLSRATELLADSVARNPFLPQSPPRDQETAPLLSATRLVTPSSFRRLPAGTRIPLTLTQAITTEVQGPLAAIVRKPVYEALTGATLLPQGATLLGEVTRVPTLGDRRTEILWTEVQLPSGKSLPLNAPTAHRDGSLGARGKVNERWGKRFGAAGVLSIVAAGIQLSQPESTSDGNLRAREIVAGELGLQTGRLSNDIIGRYLDLPPIIELSEGAQLFAVLTQDLHVPL